MRPIRTIAVLPTMFTLGNLVCGFFAIVVAARVVAPGTLAVDPQDTWNVMYSGWLIVIAMLFDALDGYVARLSRTASEFGKQLDSLCDVVTFGVAPGFLLVKMCPRFALFHKEAVWVIAASYAACAALRLARFNVAATYNLGTGARNFTGFPIPAAAGLISSLTLLVLSNSNYQNEAEINAGFGGIGLAALMVFLALMMFSKFEYPSFKGFNWRTQFSLPKFLGVVLLLWLNIIYYWWMPAVMFVSYLLYGFLRPFISRAWRREIEEDGEDEPPAAQPVAPPPPEDV